MGYPDWSETAELMKATLQSKTYPQQAYRTCLGILSLAKKYSHGLLEQACQAVFLRPKYSPTRLFSSELVFLDKQMTEPPMTTLTQP